MSAIIIQGMGAVSPAGWSVADLNSVGTTVNDRAPEIISQPGSTRTWPVRRVPAAPAPQPWMRHPRLRRASPISRFAAAAVLEALGDDATRVAAGTLRLGVVLGVMAGCVNYSRRFFQEVLVDPAMASPLVFPETVFNAPASHLAALLGTAAVNYTHVGDDSTFIQGLATAAAWLLEDRVDGCLVVGAEECDWLTSNAMALFDSREILSEGAGAVYLKRGRAGVALEAITSPSLYCRGSDRCQAGARVRRELESVGTAGRLFDSTSREGAGRQPEVDAWSGWTGDRRHVRRQLGNAFCAATAWQVIAAALSLEKVPERRAFVSVSGCNEAAIGLSLVRVSEPG
jgi:hypothetical protein